MMLESDVFSVVAVCAALRSAARAVADAAYAQQSNASATSVCGVLKVGKCGGGEAGEEMAQRGD